MVAATWSEGAGIVVEGAGHSPVGSTLWTSDSPAPTHSMKDWMRSSSAQAGAAFTDLLLARKSRTLVLWVMAA